MFDSSRPHDASESQIIDDRALLQRFMGDRQIAREMLECFRDTIPDLIETLHAHIAAADQAAALAVVKRILRLAASSSAISVQTCALQIEHAAKTGNLESTRNYLPLLKHKVFETIMAINTEYRQPETTPDVISGW